MCAFVWHLWLSPPLTFSILRLLMHFNEYSFYLFGPMIYKDAQFLLKMSIICLEYVCSTLQRQCVCEIFNERISADHDKVYICFIYFINQTCHHPQTGNSCNA